MLCKMFAYSLYVTMGCILFLQGVLAISRWAAVCTRYWFTVQKSVVLSGMGCLIPALILVLPAWGLWGNLDFDEGTGERGRGVKNLFIFKNVGTCTIISGPGGNSASVFIHIFGPGFPYFVITFCYIMIIWKLKQSRHTVQHYQPAVLRGPHTVQHHQPEVLRSPHTVQHHQPAVLRSPHTV